MPEYPVIWGERNKTLVLKGLNGRLPSFVAGRDASKIEAGDASLVTNIGVTQAADLSVDFKFVAGGDGDSGISFDFGPTKVGGSMSMIRTWGRCYEVICPNKRMHVL